MSGTINAIEIIGFQCHPHSILELSTGVNILIGESDEGKSAINRALRWLFRNSPSGDSFRNWYLKVNDLVEVGVEYSDDSWVVREKGKNTNQYKVHNLEQPLKALRTDVPDEVFEITKINDINLQRQASWFLIDDKPGAVARQFNELAELGIMDSATQVVNERVRNTNSRKKIYKENVQEIEGKIKALDTWLTPATKEMAEIDKQENDLNRLIAKETRLVEIVNSLDEVFEELDKLSFIPKVEKALVELINLQDEITANELTEKKLRALTESIGTVRSKLDAYTDIDKADIALKSLLRSSVEIYDLEEKHQRLAELIESIETREEYLKTARFEIGILDKKVKEMFEDLGMCPLCEREF